MTPEELNRTIDFIIQSQARLVAAQEQDWDHRVKFEEWSKRFDQRIIELVGIQSQRLDQNDKEHRATQKRHEQFLRETRGWQQEFRREVLSRLDRILDKLTERMN